MFTQPSINQRRLCPKHDMHAVLKTRLCDKGQLVAVRLILIGLLANYLEQSCLCFADKNSWIYKANAYI